MNNYQISVINSLKHLREIGPAWNELLKKSCSNTIFLTWEWQYAWAECFLNENKRLFAITVYSKNELVGIAPWYIHDVKNCGFPLKQINFLGTPEAGSDYLDVIIKKGKEKEVTKQLYDFLLNNEISHWDYLMLRDIPSDSLFLVYFLEKILADGKYAETTFGSYCPRVKLPKTKDNFLISLSPNRRQQYKRHLRILKKEDDIRLISNPSPGPDDINSFFVFYTEKTGYSSQHVKSMVEKLINNSKEKEIVQIDTLFAGEKKIAALLHLRHEFTMSMYLMAINKTHKPKISIGNILVGMCLEDSIRQGFSIYDFLKGTENYKFHWANSGRTSLNLIFYPKKVSSLIFLKKFLKYFAKIILR